MQLLLFWGGLAAIIIVSVWLILYLPIWVERRRSSQVRQLKRRNRELLAANTQLRKTLSSTFEVLQVMGGTSTDKLLIETTRDRIANVLIDTHASNE